MRSSRLTGSKMPLMGRVFRSRLRILTSFFQFCREASLSAFMGLMNKQASENHQSISGVWVKYEVALSPKCSALLKYRPEFANNVFLPDCSLPNIKYHASLFGGILVLLLVKRCLMRWYFSCK